MTQSTPKEAQDSQREGPARNFQSFARQMKVYLPKMNPSQRNALLKDLYRLGKNKTVREKRVARERKGAKSIAEVFRKCRQWLAKMEKILSKARHEMRKGQDVVYSFPNRAELNEIDLDEDALNKDEFEKLVIRKIVNATARVGNALENVTALVKDTQYVLAAGTNPKLRTKAEKKLVPKEPRDLTHDELLGEKTKRIDSSFDRDANSILNRYSNKDGTPIRHHARIIVAVYRVALGDPTKSAENIARSLLPSRSKQSQRPLK